MRVGLLSSWNVPCGVFQHTARLADAMVQYGLEPVILAGRADEHRSVPEESEHEVHDVAGIGLWRDDGQYWLHTDRVRDANVDVVHVQYQSMLFRHEDLERLRSDFEGPLAITFHDNCIAPDFPSYAFDMRFTHREGVGVHAERIPFGVEDRPPVVRTFGLGRSRADLIAPICERRGWVFESSASHEPIRGGGQPWRPHRELVEWLRGADLIVLWYDDNGMAGSSQAARTAMAARRQVITNDTTWFSDLPACTRGFMKVPDLETLEERMAGYLWRPYQEEHAWVHVAELLSSRYHRELAAV